MIIDLLSNVGLYAGLDRPLVVALRFLRETDLDALPLGKHEIEGTRIFAVVAEYQTKPIEQAAWEGHRKYWDVQYVAAGVERMGYVNIERAKPRTPYDADKDLEFFEGAGNFLTVHAGMFAIFSPRDVHMPGLVAGGPTTVRKIVVKVAAQP